MSFTAFDTVRRFEERIAHYAGSKFAVSVDSCCNAIFLCCVYRRQCGFFGEIQIPRFTYPGVACSVLHSGARVKFTEQTWEGTYELKPTGIIDGALRFKRGMYEGGLHCLSFHVKKHLPIGRGGMILTDDIDAWWWLKKARFDGRSEVPLNEDHITSVGWNMYMTPEQAARGLTLFDLIKDKDLPDIDMRTQNYPDLSKIEAYKCAK